MVKKLTLLVLSYLLVLVLATLFTNEGGISQFNAYILLVFVMLLVCLNPWNKSWNAIIVFASAIIMFSFGQPILYVLIDCALVFFIFSCVDIGCKYTIEPCLLRFTRNISLTIIIISLLGILSPALYIQSDDGERYGGLFHAVNFSANVFGILGICVWEIAKLSNKSHKFLLFFLVTALVLYMEACGTRSLLFFFPYWLFQVYTLYRHTRYGRFLLGLGVLGGVLLIPSLITFLTTKLRFHEGESSLATRALLYYELWTGIEDNYIILPHGAHGAQFLVERFTGHDFYSPHNDFLSYLYDWGLFFILILWSVFLRLRRAKIINGNMVLILVALSSSALHNMLFSMYLWIPLTIIFVINNDTSEKRYRSCCC